MHAEHENVLCLQMKENRRINDQTRIASSVGELREDSIEFVPVLFVAITNQHCISWPRKKSWRRNGWTRHYHYFKIYAARARRPARRLYTERRAASWYTVLPIGRILNGPANRRDRCPEVALLSVLLLLLYYKELSGFLSLSLSLSFSPSPSLCVSL